MRSTHKCGLGVRGGSEGAEGLLRRGGYITRGVCFHLVWTLAVPSCGLIVRMAVDLSTDFRVTQLQSL